MKSLLRVFQWVSVLFPVLAVFMWLRDFPHNQYSMRPHRLGVAAVSTFPDSGHLGLRAGDLAPLEERVQFAYRDAVHDGERLGTGYQQIWLAALGLDAVLFIAAGVGLRAFDRLASSNQTMELTATRTASTSSRG